MLPEKALHHCASGAPIREELLFHITVLGEGTAVLCPRTHARGEYDLAMLVTSLRLFQLC